MRKSMLVALLYGVIFLPNGQYVITADDNSGVVNQVGNGQYIAHDTQGNGQEVTQIGANVYTQPVQAFPTMPSYQPPQQQNNVPDFRMKGWGQ